jgi:hypothetical protein
MKKFTNLEDDLIKENAEVAQKFNVLYKNALIKLDQIKISLDDFAIEQVKKPGDWGYVGSLRHINEELDDILEFLSLNDENKIFVSSNPNYSDQG